MLLLLVEVCYRFLFPSLSSAADVRSYPWLFSLCISSQEAAALHLYRVTGQDAIEEIEIN